MVAKSLPSEWIAMRTIPVLIEHASRKLQVNALLDDCSTKTYINARGGLIRREFGSFPVGRLTVGRSSDSLGCFKTKFKKLTNDQEYEPIPYIMISQ